MRYRWVWKQGGGVKVVMSGETSEGWPPFWAVEGGESLWRRKRVLFRLARRQ